MIFQSPRQLILWCVLLLVVVYIHSTEQATISAPSEEDNSSSGEADAVSKDDYNETSDEQQIRKRSSEDAGNNGMGGSRLSIPGLPDPAAIMKFIELLQSIGQQIIPLVVEGINAPAEILAKRLKKDSMLLRKLKNRMDLLGR